jgi:AcrR family transcriptional regulator
MNLPQDDSSPASVRAEAQRERILNAAQQCFIESGFHAASMANIAETAGMSAGLMYRYFENKNAIVLAIIDRQLRDAHESLSRQNPASDLAADLFALFRGWQARDPSVMNAALYLEMSAEGTRDPQVAAAVRAADAQLHEELKAWIARPREQGGLGLPADKAAARVLMLQSFVRGLAVNAVRNPGLDPALVRRAIEDFVRALQAA